MYTTPETRSRLTPTLAVIISILLVMLTASGCRTTSTAREAAQRPPMEETADAGTPAPVPAHNDAAAPAPRTATQPPTPPSTKPRATVVQWTTAEPGYVPPASNATPTEPVAFTTEPVSAPAPGVTPPPPGVPQAVALEQALDRPSPPAPVTPTPTLVAAPAPQPAPQPERDSAGGEASELPLFYVFGEVEHPGPYHHTGRNRVFDIIAQVKPTRRANPAKVQLVRPAPGQSGTQAAEVFLINVDQMIRAGEMSQNLRLEAGDILYIPPTGGAKIGLALGSLLGTSADKDEPQNEE